MMMKILKAVPRYLLGAVLLASGLAGLLHMLPAHNFEGQAALYMGGIGGTYLITWVKVIEVAVGVLLLANRFVPLALILIAPIVLNILGFHALYDPSGTPVGVVLVALTAFVAWQHRAAYAPLFVASSTVREPAPSGRAVVA